MFSTLLISALCASCAILSLALPVHDPQTPRFTTVSRNVVPAANLTLSAYGGLWYEFARSPNIFEFELKCVTATYGLQADGTVSVTNRGIRMYPWFNRHSKIEGKANIPNANEPAKLRVQFDNIPAPATDFTNYWVVNTDYTQWAVVYAPTIAPVAYILTRAQQPSQQVGQAALNELAIKTGITVNDLILTQQYDC